MAVCAEYRIPHSQFLEWDQPDRDKAIWFLMRQREACSDCGTRPDEWKPEKGGHPQAHVARVRRCPGCKEVHRFKKELGDKQPAGTFVVLKPNPALES